MVSLLNVTGVVAFGDSYVVGSPYATYNLPGYIYQFASQHNLTVTNLAEGGTPLFNHLRQANLNLGTNRTQLAFLGGSFHDSRLGGNNAKTYIKDSHLYRGWLATSFLSTMQAASSGTNNGMVTAWPLATAQMVGCRCTQTGGLPMAGGLGTSLSFNVTGSKIVVGYIIADGVTQSVGRFKVTIDGVSHGIITPNGNSYAWPYPPYGYDEARVPAVAIFNVSPGNHTVLIEPQDSQQNGPWSIIDYVGTLVDPAQAAPVLISTPPKMNSTGYSLGSPQWSNSNDALVKLQATIIEGVVQEFQGYPIAIVEVNNFFNVDTDVYTDNVHPNYSGETNLLNALNSGVQ